MSKFKEKFSSLKFSEQSQPVSLGMVMTQDGVTLNYDGDSLAVGSMVTIDGQPAPDGSYTLEDGTVCTIVGGAVTEITPADPNPNQPDPINYEAQFAEIENKFKDFETKFAEMMSKVDELGKTFSEAAGQMATGFSLMEKFSSQEPEPAKSKKDIAKEAGENRLSLVAEKVKQLRKS